MRVVEEVVVVGAVDLGQVLLREMLSSGRPRWRMRRDQHLGRRLQVHDEVRTRHALRQQRVELLVHEQLAVLEVQVGEEPALLEHVVGDGRVREEVPLQQLLLLAVAREQEEELRLERRARPPVVERLQERVLSPLLEQRGRVQPLGQALRPPPSCRRRSRPRPRCSGSSTRGPRFRRRAAPRATCRGSAREQRRGCVTPSRGWTQVGRQLAQGHEHETALVQPRVGEGQAGPVADERRHRGGGRGRGCAARCAPRARGRARAPPPGRPPSSCLRARATSFPRRPRSRTSPGAGRPPAPSSRGRSRARG